MYRYLFRRDQTQAKKRANNVANQVRGIFRLRMRASMVTYAQKVHRTGAQPALIYGRQVPSTVRLRRQASKVIAGKGSGRCLTTTWALLMGGSEFGLAWQSDVDELWRVSEGPDEIDDAELLEEVAANIKRAQRPSGAWPDCNGTVTIALGRCNRGSRNEASQAQACARAADSRWTRHEYPEGAADFVCRAGCWDEVEFQRGPDGFFDVFGDGWGGAELWAFLLALRNTRGNLRYRADDMPLVTGCARGRQRQPPQGTNADLWLAMRETVSESGYSRSARANLDCTALDTIRPESERNCPRACKQEHFDWAVDEVFAGASGVQDEGLAALYVEWAGLFLARRALCAEELARLLRACTATTVLQRRLRRSALLARLVRESSAELQMCVATVLAAFADFACSASVKELRSFCLGARELLMAALLPQLARCAPEVQQYVVKAIDSGEV
ncbi:unnamed protein product [Prorocentrum cordatum]|uniref:Nuclear pore complex protein Nup85 n=1 Tax=Prorocentrum cordatum TaxID=2364126 RepID=A0ABN9XT16_9DINO|nr:unnamed protein product [Polarella glacialis]